MNEKTNVSYVKQSDEPSVMMTEKMLMDMVEHPQYQPFIEMIEEAVNKDYEGGIVIQNCFPQEWDNTQVGFMIYSIQQSYEQVVSAEFYAENGMYLFIKNKNSPLVTDLVVPTLKSV